jgi:N,N'-diacetyllegionaminate synthase
VERKVKTYRIGTSEIGGHGPPLVVAEVGFNHNGEIGLARQMVAAAAGCGCDGVKFQAFHGPELFAQGFVERRDDGSSWRPAEFYAQYELSDDAYAELAQACRERGVLFLCTPFDLKAAAMLERLDVPAYKIASGDLTYEHLIRTCAATGRPMIVSTGIGRLADVEAAVRFCEGEGNKQILLLHCTASYPCEPQDVHLRAMQLLERAFGYPVGLSDHTVDTAVAMAATALGAVMIEKHFTTDRSLPGFDQQMSADPAAMRELITGCRTVHAAMGEARKGPRESESRMAFFGRRSLVYASDLPAGTVLTDAHLGAKRPAVGIAAQNRALVAGRRLRCDVKADAFVKWSELDGD